MAKSLFALAAGLFIVAPVMAGVVFEIETSEQIQGRTQTAVTRVSVEGRMMTMAIPPDQPGERGDQIIFRGDRQEMLIIDHDRKSFMVMDRQMLQNISGQIGQMAGQLDEAMKNIPAAQRAMAEQPMKNKLPGQPQRRSQVSVRRLDERAQVYGYPCVLFEVLRDGKRIRNFWVTDWDNLEGGRRELAPVFDEMGSFFQELQVAMPQMGESDGMTNNAFAQIKQLGGFPVATREYTQAGDLESESALRSAKRQAISPTIFTAPAGYRREEILGGGQAPQFRR